MSPLFIAAIVAINVALVFYSIGVFGERRAGVLGKKHLIFFWLGFVCDTTGTTIMTVMANSSTTMGSPLHAVSGAIAIALMAFHAIWATAVLVRDNEKWRASFHRLSIVVWLFWLVPYIVGMLLGMPMIHLDDAVVAALALGIVIAMGIVFCIEANVKSGNIGKRVQRG